MAINKRDLVLFIMDKLPKGVVPIKENEYAFLLKTAIGEDSDGGYLYDANHNLVYHIDNDKRSVSGLTLVDLIRNAELNEVPLLMVKVAKSNLKQAYLKIYETSNVETKGRVGLDVDLKGGYMFSDIPWLPAFCIDEAYTEFKVLASLFEDLTITYKDKLAKDKEKEEARVKRKLMLEQMYSVEEQEHESTDSDKPPVYSTYSEEDTVYVVETISEETLKVTTNKDLALLFGESQLNGCNTIFIKTWVDGECVKTMTLSEG